MKAPIKSNFYIFHSAVLSLFADTSRAGDKYETTSTVSGYTKYMKLKIRSVGPNDFGTYRCVAKNSLGETDGNIKLDGRWNLYEPRTNAFAIPTIPLSELTHTYTDTHIQRNTHTYT